MKSRYKQRKELRSRKSPEQILNSLGMSKESVQRAASEVQAKLLGDTPTARRLLANVRMVR